MADQEIELSEVQDIPAEEGAGIDADNAEAVVIEFSWLSSMEVKLVSTYHTESSPFTIRRVPANIRQHDHAAYNPKNVSIGPFHRGSENLQAMEEFKWRYLHNVLAIALLKSGNNLENFLKKMKEIETQARNCYSESIQMTSNEFVEMMVLDGCFLIFLILERVNSVEMDDLIPGYKRALIPDYERMSGLIFIDMLLLENQLPFFVLECLWELIGIHDILRNAALVSYQILFPSKLELKSSEEDIIHLLHLLHLSLKPDSSTKKSQTTSATSKLSSLRLCQRIGKTLRFLCPTPSQHSLSEFERKGALQLWNRIPSATELQEAGVRFQSKQARSFFEVRFERGLMEMPRLFLLDSTAILFRNFIALEQCFPKWGNHYTSYCHFIDFLVDTSRDVSILREADIITNGMGSNEEAALFFNKLCSDTVWNVDGSYLADLFQKVNQHTKKRLPRWRAKLVRDYFGSPWAIISLIAAVIILILTFLQTYFSVFAYFNPPKP